MKPAQRRKKGQRFERIVAKEIEAEGLGKAGREAMSGGGYRKGDIACNLDFMLECKNQKAIHFLNWVDQSKEQARIGNWNSDKWALISMDPRTSETNPQIYATIDFWQFLRLLKKNSEPLIKEPDKEMRWDLERLKIHCQKIIKQLE